MKTTHTTWLKAAAYDPSCRKADAAGYWQWSNTPMDSQWDHAVECVNKGWPSVCRFNDPGARWYGVLNAGRGRLWIYRIYAAGRDGFGRPGRHFFVLALLRSRNDLLDPHVAGLFSYFDAERGLPLVTDPLDDGWLDAKPDEILCQISGAFDANKTLTHWGMGDEGKAKAFGQVSPLPQSAMPPAPHRLPITVIRGIRSGLSELAGVFQSARRALRLVQILVLCCTGAALLVLIILMGLKIHGRFSGDSDTPRPGPPGQKSEPTPSPEPEPKPEPQQNPPATDPAPAEGETGVEDTPPDPKPLHGNESSGGSEQSSEIRTEP